MWTRTVISWARAMRAPSGRSCSASRIGTALAAAAFATAIPISEADAFATPRLKPPAPAPRYISKNDLERIATLREALRRKTFATAKSTAGFVSEPIAWSLAQWYYFEAEDPNVAIDEADAFLDGHPDWPSLSKIQRHVEKQLDNDTPTSDVLALFDNRDPLTANGKMHLARALFANGERDAAVLHIRDAWINDTFRQSEETRFLSSYGGHLRSEDHAARVDRLLWARQVTNARRVFRYLAVADRRRADVRAQLLLAAKNAGTAYDRLGPEDRLDPGVLLAAVRYFRRSGEEPRAISLARLAPDDPDALRNPSRWWDERQLLMRWALKNRRYADAYAMTAGHGLVPGSTDFSEAEFDAGWIALRFLGDPARAEVHFAALASSVATPISLARGYYWMGRAAAAMDDAERAARWYAEAARHPYSYYGQLAAEEIGGSALEARFGESAPASPEDKASFASRPAAQALRILTEVGDDRAFLIFGYHLDGLLRTQGEFMEFADVARRIAATHVTVRAGKVAVRAGAFAPEVAYPTIYIPESATRFAPPELILGVSRQESEFNPRAYSRAGARGLMQLIPSTAELTARKERLPYRRSALLNDPDYNMQIGAAHLSHLLRDFNGSYPMVFAAYNAGPHRVRRWIQEFGDPRSAGVDPVDWVEQIPFSETRNYVQRVLENMQVYRGRLNEQPIPGKLAADLERGGPRSRIAALPASRAAGDRPEISLRIVQAAKKVLDATPQEEAAPLTPSDDAGAPAPETADPKTATEAPTDPVVQSVATAPRDGATEPATNAPTAPPAEAAAAPPQQSTAARATPDPALAGTTAVPTENAPAAAQRTAARPSASAQPAVSQPTGAQPAGAQPAAEPTIAKRPAAVASAGAHGVVDNREGAGRSNAGRPAAPASGETTDVAACLGYSAYLAAADPEGASAADLNAGSLAELASGGPQCAPARSTSDRAADAPENE